MLSTPLAILPDIGGGEMMVILLLVLLLFGGDKMPQLAKGIGKSLRELRKAAGDVEQEFKRALDEVPDNPTVKPAPPAPQSPAAISRTEPPPAPPQP